MTTTIYWGINDTTLYLASSSQGYATTSFEIGSSMTPSSWPWYSSRTSLTTVNVLNTITFNTATNLQNMFYGCTGLTSLDVSNFNTSNVTNMSDMFDNCSGLTSLNLSNFNTSNVTNMWGMFFNCTGLTSLDVSNFNTSNVTNMSDMFYNCSGLTSLNLSNFNTSKVTEMWGMFNNCSGLTSLNLSNFNTSKVTEMWGMFYGCRSLTSLDVSNFNTSKVTNLDDMFNNCSDLTSLDVSSFNTSEVTSMSDMFYNCSGLTTIYVSQFWSTTKLADGWRMFADSTSLVGGNGTIYDANYTDETYARIDATGSPGYFTFKYHPGFPTEAWINLNGYHYVGTTDPYSTDSACLHFDINKEAYSTTALTETDNKLVAPTTATVITEERNILHLKGIHGFYIKTQENPHVIDRIRKGYIDDNEGTLTTNSDGYLTYAPGAGISIGI